ncbi:MAG: hypothetical protein ACFBRM_06555 [Pikeienuella sp.]
MQTLFLAIALAGSATLAFAHPGHVAPLDGHAHGEMLALAAAAAVAFLALRRWRS